MAQAGVGSDRPAAQAHAIRALHTEDEWHKFAAVIGVEFIFADLTAARGTNLLPKGTIYAEAYGNEYAVPFILSFDNFSAAVGAVCYFISCLIINMGDWDALSPQSGFDNASAVQEQ